MERLEEGRWGTMDLMSATEEANAASNTSQPSCDAEQRRGDTKRQHVGSESQLARDSSQSLARRRDRAAVVQSTADSLNVEVQKHLYIHLLRNR